MAAGDDRQRGAGVYEELYDLGIDPGETTNIAAERPDERDRFREVAAEHLRVVAATDTDLDQVEMDEAAASRLRDLGYRE